MNFITRVIVFSLGTALFVSSMAPSAGAIRGNQFLSLCSKNADEPDRDFCRGYVFAIAEALHGLGDQTVCINGASPETLLDTAMSYIGSLPEPGQQSSGELVVTALETNFPC